MSVGGGDHFHRTRKILQKVLITITTILAQGHRQSCDQGWGTDRAVTMDGAQTELRLSTIYTCTNTDTIMN